MRYQLVRRSLALAGAALLISATAVSADDISNDLDATIDIPAEVMALSVGGSDGTTNLYVQPQGGDGKPGCNLTGSTTLILNVVNGNPSVATVSPTSVTFTSCGSTPTLTVTPLSQGSTTVGLILGSNNSGGSFNLSPATFTVNVSPPPNTPPQVSITGVAGGASYEIGNVPTATCQVTDTEDGNSSFPATLSVISGPLSAHGLGVQEASCSYTDDGGLLASSSVTYSIVDTTAPAITFDSRTPANANGWNNSDVTVTWACSDAGGSGVIAASVSETVSTEGENQSATGTCQDYAGNTASDTQADINIDLTDPTISFDNADPAANGNGWNNSDVTLTWNCEDTLSGPVDASVSELVSTEGLNQSATGTCADLAGNTASDTKTGINIDETDPDSPSFVGGPADGGSYFFGSVPAAPTCTSDDELSGLTGCAVSDYSAAVGSHTMTATATDNADNSASATRSYTVLAWTLSGFYSPVDMNGMLNIVKGGSTVPLKFEVFAGSTELTQVSVVDTFTAQPVSCGALTAGTDDIEVTTTGSTSLRYDASGGQFIQNWQTPKAAGVCYRTTMKTDDGSSIVAYFKTK